MRPSRPGPASGILGVLGCWPDCVRLHHARCCTLAGWDTSRADSRELGFRVTSPGEACLKVDVFERLLWLEMMHGKEVRMARRKHIAGHEEGPIADGEAAALCTHCCPDAMQDLRLVPGREPVSSQDSLRAYPGREHRQRPNKGPAPRPGMTASLTQSRNPQPPAPGRGMPGQGFLLFLLLCCCRGSGLVLPLPFGGGKTAG